MLKRILCLSLLMITLLSLFILGHVFLEHSSAATFKQVLLHYHGVFILWRYSVYAIVLIFWPKLIVKLGKKRQWSTEIIETVSQQRLKLLGLFICIEALFAYNLLGHLFALLG